MPETITDFLHGVQPTAERPLLGHTVLLVEDSRYASEAMRLLCLRSGARIRRADSLAAAARHLRSYRPSVIIVDLGLPDGSGLDFIADLAATPVRADVILATSGDPALADEACAAGADGFLPKPVTAVAAFQEAILSRLPAEARPKGPRVLPNDHVAPDRLALRDDLEHILDLLTDTPDAGTLRYASRFLAGLARTAEDSELAAVAEDIAHRPAESGLDRLTRLVEGRLPDRKVV
jgi:DNA-binding NarL/FixJ family response regulator